MRIPRDRIFLLERRVQAGVAGAAGHLGLPQMVPRAQYHVVVAAIAVAHGRQDPVLDCIRLDVDRL